MTDLSWHRWRRDVFGDPYLVWHDGPDCRQLVPAATADPDTVVRMLAAGLAEHDQVAALAFEFLADQGVTLPGAIDLLRAAAAGATSQFLVYVARALFASTSDPSWAEPIAEVLAGGDSEFVRLDAARALALFPPTRALIEQVARAVCDHQYLVRYHAGNTLQRYAGIKRDIGDNATRFRKLASPGHGCTTDVDRQARREVADELAAKALARLPGIR